MEMEKKLPGERPGTVCGINVDKSRGEKEREFPKRIRIGTRKSKLALIQTDMVIAMMKEHFADLEVEVVTMQTTGDKLLHQSLNKIGGKGVFTQELEQALLRGEIDMAVHSAKDMPLVMPEGVSLYPVGIREDASDVLVSCRPLTTDESIVVGTSSLRRSIQIKRMYKKARIKDIRGNVETRLQKLLTGEYDAIILANAGLKRIAPMAEEGLLEQFTYNLLDKDVFLPAACQGILALETRSNEFAEIIEALTDAKTGKSFEIEREFLRVMAGGCNAPCGIHTRILEHGAYVNAFFAKEAVLEEKGYEIIGDRSFFEKRDRKSSKLRRVKKVSKVITDLSEIGDIVGRLKYGTVSLVGAGIGDEEYLTRKALSKIREADCIVYDKLLAASILNEARLDAKLIYVGKSFGQHSMKQEAIHALLAELARSGKDVVRLKGGDPFVFGRGSEEALFLKKEGIEFELIPGISSCIAVPENAGIPVTHREVATSFHVITGHETGGAARLDESIAKLGGTMVFLMGLNNAAQIAGDLMKFGKDENTKVAIISRGMSARERTYFMTLKEVAGVVQKERIVAPVIIVIGDVVGIGQELGAACDPLAARQAWREGVRLKEESGSDFGKEQKRALPLFGKSVLITGTRSMVNKLRPQIKKAGGRDIAVSLIETVYEPSAAFELAMRTLEEYRYIIFTSSNGIEAFFRYIRDLTDKGSGFDQRRIAHLKFAVIGEGSRDTLRAYGYVEDFMPSAFTSVALANELLPELSRVDKVLLVRAKEANRYLTQKLDEAGIPYTDAYIYRTHVDDRRVDELHRALREVDYVTLASPSAVLAFRGMAGIKMLEEAHEEYRSALTKDMRKADREIRLPRIAVIGPETARECEKQGITVDVTADVNTAKGLVDAMAADAMSVDADES